MTGGIRTVSDKTMKDLQAEVDEYIGQFKEGYFSPLAMMARLTEELGELAREVNHYYGEKPKKTTENEKSMEEEMGDVLFVLICLANSLIFHWRKLITASCINLIHVIKTAGLEKKKESRRNHVK